jgi:hypothetical protein
MSALITVMCPGTGAAIAWAAAFNALHRLTREARAT